MNTTTVDATDTEIMAFGARHNNAELMRDCAALGYLEGPVLDLTYGLGRFWTLHRPPVLHTNDLDPNVNAEAHWDFTNVPLDGAEFGAVVFDPPYKLNGTSKPRGPATSDISYGVGDYMPMKARHKLMRDGLTEAFRITRSGGHVLAKCMDQVSASKVRWQTHMLTVHAYGLTARGQPAEGRKIELVDELHVRGYRQQPPGRPQRHARRDYSTLLVFEVK